MPVYGGRSRAGAPEEAVTTDTVCWRALCLQQIVLVENTGVDPNLKGYNFIGHEYRWLRGAY